MSKVGHFLKICHMLWVDIGHILIIGRVLIEGDVSIKDAYCLEGYKTRNLWFISNKVGHILEVCCR